QRYIWTTETGLAGAPSTAPMGLGMCGPMLIGHGTQAQKDYFLPRILSGEDYWCQGYSEPTSGSDLASLSLKATTDGDDFILNGSKIWTTHAHYANRMFLLVRSDDSGKPQQGITFLLLEMDSPGITVNPILFASDTHEVNQVFFDNVRVPKTNIVGQENEGWTVAKYLLEFERGGGGAARFHTALKRLRLFAEETASNGERLIDDPAFATRLNETAVKIEAIQFTEFRIMAAMAKGGSPGPESSIMKNMGADMGQWLSEMMVEALAFYAAVHQPAAREVGQNVPIVGPASGVTAFPRYFNYRAQSIAGGTNEVQANIVAKMVLGL
ncbi:MAG: acyl-CoA dehydrogenase family protein, partial [Pseudomonadota bacterium]